MVAPAKPGPGAGRQATNDCRRDLALGSWPALHDRGVRLRAPRRRFRTRTGQPGSPAPHPGHRFDSDSRPSCCGVHGGIRPGRLSGRGVRVDGAARADELRAGAARDHVPAGPARSLQPVDVGVVSVPVPAPLRAHRDDAGQRPPPGGVRLLRRRASCRSRFSTGASPSCTSSLAERPPGACAAAPSTSHWCTRRRCSSWDGAPTTSTPNSTLFSRLRSSLAPWWGCRWPSPRGSGC